MRQADHDPVQQQRGDNQRHQQAKSLFRQHIVDQHHQRCDPPRKQQRIHRHATAADAGQKLRGVTLNGQTKQHAAVGIDAAIINGQRGHQNDKIQRRCHQVAVHIVEDHHERAAVGFHLDPRIERQQYHQRTDVKQQNAVHHLIDRFRNAFLRIARFSGRNPDKLKPAKGEHNDCQRHDKPVPAGRQEAAVFPQVVDVRTLAAMTGEQQPQTKADHPDNRQHFYQRKPELGFTVKAHVYQVDGVDDNEEGGGPNPGRDVRQPVLHVDASGGEFRHAYQHKHHPVVPARQETGERPPVFIRKVRKRAGYGLFNDHFTQLAHDQKSNNACDAIPQQNGRSGHLNRRPNAEKQPGTDRAAEGN